MLKNQWNSEKVKSAFIEDKERLLKETLNLNLDEAAKFLTELKEKGKLEKCPSCYEEEVTNFVSMDCGHALCIFCYTNHVNISFSKGPEVVLCICPVAPCKMIVSYEIF